MTEKNSGQAKLNRSPKTLPPVLPGGRFSYWNGRADVPEFRASQAPDRSAFNLTHAFTGKPHLRTDFFKRMVVVVPIP